jgi:AcrR family transcriptional regulator
METLLEGPDLKTARRERRALKRRAEILDAALRVFERVGYEAASTRLIAEEADVSEGTIYNYFPDKGELCIRALKQGSGLAAVVAHMQQPGEDFEARLKALGRWRAQHMPRQAALLELLAQVIASPKLRARYQEEIWGPAAAAMEVALAAEAEPLTTAPALATRVLMASMLGVWLMSLADPTLAALFENAGETTMADVHAMLWRSLRPA